MLDLIEAPQVKQPSLDELIELCAVDNDLFGSTFFPKTARQKSPPFHKEIWELLESNHRLVNLQVFRGGAKTSILRMYTAKRIAYHFAHTILYVGKSEGHATRSVKWLRRQIEFNKPFAQAYQLKPGSKWQDTEAEIFVGKEEKPVWIIAMGITGSVRGINMDDFRPDLIVVDDVLDEENSATPGQRQKISDLIYGALKESLAPESEAPDAKLAMLQTPMGKEDASTLALDDPEWKSKVFGCFTEATTNLSLHNQESVWPERWTSEVLRNEKRAAIERNKLSLFIREKECKIISPETSSFREEWLQFYDLLPEDRITSVMAVDPVPPPSDIQIAKGMRGKDYEAFAVVGRHKGNFYLLEYSIRRGHEPDWSISEFFRLCLKWLPRKVIVEAVAYQRTLAWLFKKAMDHQRRYFVIQEMTDKRSKYDRIVDGLSGPSANKKLFIRKDHHEFIAQFRAYPDIANDDLIEAVAVAVAELSNFGYDESAYEDLMEEEDDIPVLAYVRGAP